MPRARERLTLESGPVLDLAKIIPKGAAKPGVQIRNEWIFSTGEVIGLEVRLWEEHGSLDLSFEGRRQSFTPASQSRHFGGSQWYVVCPNTCKLVRMLFRACRHLGDSGAAQTSIHRWFDNEYAM